MKIFAINVMSNLEKNTSFGAKNKYQKDSSTLSNRMIPSERRIYIKNSGNYFKNLDREYYSKIYDAYDKYVRGECEHFLENDADCIEDDMRDFNEYLFENRDN